MSALPGILFDGVAYGSLLFVISVGLSVTLGMMNFVNLAHGAFAMLGGYVCVLATTRLRVPFLASVPLAFAASALAGLLLERLFFRRLYNAGHLSQVLFTVGLTLASIAGATFLFGSRQLSVELPASLQARVAVFGFETSAYRLFLVAIVLSLTAVLAAFVRLTRFGAQLRATVDDPVAAAGSGINVDATFATAFAVGSGLAGFGGAVGVEILAIEPSYPLKYLVDFLLIAVLGGAGTIVGPLLAAMLIGTLDILGKYYVPQVGALGLYALLPVLVATFPTGLFGRRR